MSEYYLLGISVILLLGMFYHAFKKKKIKRFLLIESVLIIVFIVCRQMYSSNLRTMQTIMCNLADNISDAKTFEREVAPLFQIKDAYPKILLARIRDESYQYEGIQIMDIADWLAERPSISQN